MINNKIKVAIKNNPIIKQTNKYIGVMATYKVNVCLNMNHIVLFWNRPNMMEQTDNTKQIAWTDKSIWYGT